MAAAWKALDPALRDALRTAAAQIREFAKRQMPKSWNVRRYAALRPANSCGHSVPSAATCPAAGIRSFDAADDGNSRAGRWCKAYRRGLAQARAGDACRGAPARYYGVLSPRRRACRGRAGLRNRNIPRVDKIVGPGNLYVTAAKRLVAFDCAIDMLAGPTSRRHQRARQCRRHCSRSCSAGRARSEALAIFITTREDLAKDVIAEQGCEAETMPWRAPHSTATELWSWRIVEEARQSPIALRPNT